MEIPKLSFEKLPFQEAKEPQFFDCLWLWQSVPLRASRPLTSEASFLKFTAHVFPLHFKSIYTESEHL